MREALETPGKTAALITPDVAIARRVSAELARWGVEVEDSAGRTLGADRGRRVRAARARRRAAISTALPLVALFAHPLTRLARAPKRCKTRRAGAGDRRLSRRHAALGPRRHRRADGKRPRRRARSLRPRRAAGGSARTIGAPPKRCCATPTPPRRRCARSAPRRRSALSSPPIAPRSTRLPRTAEDDFDGEDGARRTAARRCANSSTNGPRAPSWASPAPFPTMPRCSTRLFPASARPAGHATHPRLQILGLLEARLLSFDLALLAGLDETTWPPAAQTDAFLNRPMRASPGPFRARAAHRPDRA